MRSQIVKLERGERRLTIDWMLRLAKHLGCDPRDLLPEKAENGSREPGRPCRPRRPPPGGGAGVPLRDLPVCGAARGGANALFIDQGQALEYAFRPPQLVGVANAFAVYAVGDSMEPKFRAGDLLYINPNLPPVRGCFVVVELGENEAYVKQYLRQSDDVLCLREFNPAQGGDGSLSFPMPRIKAIHRVVGSWEGQ